MDEKDVLWQLGSVTFHAKTLVMTWITMLVILIFCYFATRKATSGRPGGAQNVLEWLFDFVRGMINESMDWKKGGSLLTYLVTLIMFLFFANMLGLVPNITLGLFHNVHFAHLDEIFTGPNLKSPTADVNTTGALAVLTLILFNYYGFKFHKAKYLKHFVEPFAVFLPINLVELVAKPMTLAMRLFGNIFAGEVLIKLILSLPGLALIVGGAVLNPVWLGFSVFVGVIQAFVFTALTLAYVSQSVGTEEH